MEDSLGNPNTPNNAFILSMSAINILDPDIRLL